MGVFVRRGTRRPAVTRGADLLVVFAAGAAALGGGCSRRPEPAVPPAPALNLDLGGGQSLEMVFLAPGRFMMGSNRLTIETPVHEVEITRGFYLGRREVTWPQYEAVMGVADAVPGGSKGPDLPVEGVSWDDASDFCRQLSERAGREVRLPTEAEWEYACRAGSTTAYSFGDSEAEIDRYAWTENNAGSRAHPVGTKRPNVWGLYDMHGNVWEWCSDWFDAGYYARSPMRDPKGPAAGQHRVMRGAGWYYYPRDCRSSLRGGGVPANHTLSIGFRTAAAPL